MWKSLQCGSRLSLSTARFVLELNAEENGFGCGGERNPEIGRQHSRPGSPLRLRPPSVQTTCSLSYWCTVVCTLVRLGGPAGHSGCKASTQAEGTRGQSIKRSLKIQSDTSSGWSKWSRGLGGSRH
uniref:Uncharacterized protein n=1 Tax=Salarias fasciatus TaxID=181472 RepID=A0A672H8C1_SALFA